MSETMVYTGTLTITNCWCGIKHAVPQSLYNHQKNQKDAGEVMDAIYCPLGHKWYIAGESEAKRLKRQLEDARNAQIAERQRHDQTKAELRETERRRVAQKGVTTRIKNRVQHGVCPCCKRTFKDLQRHMAGQHPNFAASEA